MPTPQTVLLLGGTGRTGRLVLEQLLDRGVSVRAVVRSGRKLPAGVAGRPNLAVVEADLLPLSDVDLLHQLRGCDAVISCLGHVLDFKGIFGPPRDLVTLAAIRVCRGIETLHPAAPVKFILMSSVSVHRPGGLDARRGKFERAMLWVLRGLVPPAKDNQQAADFLHGVIGPTHRCAQWVAVRPDSLLEGGVSGYTVHDGLVSSLFRPDSTNRANVAHFMCELVTNPKAWEDWKGKLPVIVNAKTSRS
jgi:hypothetical protein